MPSTKPNKHQSNRRTSGVTNDTGHRSKHKTTGTDGKQRENYSSTSIKSKDDFTVVDVPDAKKYFVLNNLSREEIIAKLQLNPLIQYIEHLEKYRKSNQDRINQFCKLYYSVIKVKKIRDRDLDQSNRQKSIRDFTVEETFLTDEEVDKAIESVESKLEEHQLKKMMEVNESVNAAGETPDSVSNVAPNAYCIANNTETEVIDLTQVGQMTVSGEEDTNEEIVDKPTSEPDHHLQLHNLVPAGTKKNQPSTSSARECLAEFLLEVPRSKPSENQRHYQHQLPKLPNLLSSRGLRIEPESHLATRLTEHKLPNQAKIEPISAIPPSKPLKTPDLVLAVTKPRESAPLTSELEISSQAQPALAISSHAQPGLAISSQAQSGLAISSQAQSGLAISSQAQPGLSISPYAQQRQAISSQAPVHESRLPQVYQPVSSQLPIEQSARNPHHHHQPAQTMAPVVRKCELLDSKPKVAAKNEMKLCMGEHMLPLPKVFNHMNMVERNRTICNLPEDIRGQYLNMCWEYKMYEQLANAPGRDQLLLSLDM